MLSRRLMIIGFVLLTVAPLARGQKVSETMNVTVVEVPVTVLDRAGNPLVDLSRKNFHLFDEGKEVDITYFEKIQMDAVPTKEERKFPLNPVATRNFLILFDLTNSQFGNIGRAKEAAREFVVERLGENDVAAVATFSVESGFRLVVNFTRDQKLLGDAIETLGDPDFFRPIDPLFISAVVGPSPSAGSSGLSGDARAGRSDPIESNAADFQRLNQQQHREYMAKRVRAQLENFGAIARLLDRIPGQKQVILLSEGFDASVIHGREQFGDQGAAEFSAAVSGEVWKIDSDARYGNVETQNELEQMAEMFRRSDVVLHAIDIKGLRSDVDASRGLSRSSNEALFLMTRPTGGEVFKNSNDLTTTFERMMNQQQVVYLLGFQADPSGEPGKFHNLSVKVDDVPRGTRTNHRAGYYEPSPASAIEKVMTASEILLNDIPHDELKFEMLTVPFPVGEKAQVPVVMEIDGPKLMEGVEGQIASGEIFVYAFDREGRVQDFIHEKLALDLKQVAKTLESSGIRYYGTLSLAPGYYAIKALIRINESGHIGFKRTDLRVPDFDSAQVLPPLSLADEGNWIMLRGRSYASDDFEYPFVIGQESFIPGVARALDRNQKHRVALMLYHLPPDQLDLSIILRSKSGGGRRPANVSLIGRTPLDDRGRVGLLFDFATSDLVRGGEYVLDFSVTPKGGTTQSVEMPFVIR